MPTIEPFIFTVVDTFQIEGRGLILSPFFSLDRYSFDGKERVRVVTPDGRMFEAEADVEIPHVCPTPKTPQAMFVLRNLHKDEVPVGSIMSVLDKSVEQVTNSSKSEQS